MGQTLDRPNDVKTCEQGEGNGLRHGVSSMQGWRLDMEDAHTAIPCLSDGFSGCSYYAVFDGHAGAYTSGICSQRLHETILKSLANNNVDMTMENFDDSTTELIDRIVRDAFVAFDDDLKISGPYKSAQESCGTTAIGVFVTPFHIIFCNCGDSRGFLSREKAVLFQTKDHKPSDRDEKDRIEKSGGGVIMDRVNGNLAVSRALGDFSFKDNQGLDTRKQAVSPEPDVTILKRNNDDFIVLACDGIWDVLNCEQVRYFVDCRMKVHRDLSKIAAELIDLCLMKDSRDNMSVIIIALESAPEICETEVEQEKIYDAQLRRYVLEYVDKNSTSFALLNTLNALVAKDLHPCLASEFGVYAKVRLVESVLNEYSPQRSREGDYNSNSFIGSYPMAWQAIKSLVTSKRGVTEDLQEKMVSSDSEDDTPDSNENIQP